MNESLYPTPEAIEAALSAYDAQHPDGSLNDEGKLFMEIMASNERLRAEIHRAAEFVGELSVPPEMAGFTAEQIRLYKVSMLCDTFFWVGWHARGAIDDREGLERMAE